MKLKYTLGKLELLEDMAGESFLMMIQKPKLRNLILLAWAGMDDVSVDEAEKKIEKGLKGSLSVTKLLEAIIEGLQEGGFLDKDLPQTAQ